MKSERKLCTNFEQIFHRQKLFSGIQTEVCVLFIEVLLEEAGIGHRAKQVFRGRGELIRLLFARTNVEIIQVKAKT